MKLKATIQYLLLFLLTANSIFCQSNTMNNNEGNVYSEEQILITLKAFYSNYIKQYSKIESEDNVKIVIDKINSIKKKYCTTRLMNKIENEELDEDPFLKSQDFNVEWSNTLRFRKDSKKQNIYIVSYSYYDNYKRTNINKIIKLTLVKQNGCYKIDSVW